MKRDLIEGHVLGLNYTDSLFLSDSERIVPVGLVESSLIESKLFFWD